jgi:hypothetical protein
MNYYKQKCPHFKLKCADMSDPYDKCTYDGDCYREIHNKNNQKIDKKLKSWRKKNEY